MESVFDTLTAVAASNSLYPGIYLYLEGKDGKEFEAALFEAISEYPSDDQTALRVLVWRNPESDIIFEGEIMVNDIDGHRYLNFYMAAWFDVDAVFGTNINAKENDDNPNVYADYDIGAKNVMDRLDVMIHHADGEVTKLAYHLDDDEKIFF